MHEIDTTVKRETAYIAAWVIVFSVLMQAVFLVIGIWDLTVLWGNLLGGAAAVVNFFLMGLTVQKAVTQEEAQAKDTVRLSQTVRMTGLVLIAVIGLVLPCFHAVAVVIPLLFPRIAIFLRPLFDKKKSDQ